MPAWQSGAPAPRVMSGSSAGRQLSQVNRWAHDTGRRAAARRNALTCVRRSYLHEIDTIEASLKTLQAAPTSSGPGSTAALDAASGGQDVTRPPSRAPRWGRARAGLRYYCSVLIVTHSASLPPTGIPAAAESYRRGWASRARAPNVSRAIARACS